MARKKKGLHSLPFFRSFDPNEFKDVDWDEEIWGGTEFDPAAENLEPAAEAPKAPKSYGKSYQNTWGWSSLQDPTDSFWDLKREARHREEQEHEANERLDKAAGSFKKELERIAPQLAEAGVLDEVTQLLGAHADLVIEKVRKDYVLRETERITKHGSISPKETQDEFMDLGARYYRVLKLDPYISQADLDLLAASLEAVRYITPARTWAAVDREIEDAANEALREVAQITGEKGDS